MSKHVKLEEVALACGIALSLAQISGAAAFTPEPVAPPSASTQQLAPVQGGQQLGTLPQIPQAQLADPFPAKKEGTEVTIPGLGSVGTLPKLDFGLELLYGPKNIPEGVQLDTHGKEGDVQIKGSLTHKF
jgi:hypothetical protein